MSVTGIDTQESPAAHDGPTVFVSYRRSDSPSAARQVADALRARFGAEQVFFDTRDLAPGMMRFGGLLSRYYKWREGVGPAAKRPWMRN